MGRLSNLRRTSAKKSRQRCTSGLRRVVRHRIVRQAQFPPGDALVDSLGFYAICFFRPVSTFEEISMLPRGVIFTMSTFAFIGLLAGVSFALPSGPPGHAMSDFEAASIAGADCGYQEDGGGSDIWCCSWCWTGGWGMTTGPEYRSTSGICLSWSGTATCPCGESFTSLGSNQCAY